MDVQLSPEQRELQRTVRDLAADRASSAHRRAVIDAGADHDPELWRLVSQELGLPAIAVAEHYDGVGGSFVDVAVVLEEAGRALLPVPLLATVVAAAAAPDDEALGRAVAAGGRAALAIGDPVTTLTHVVDGKLADQVVVAAADGLFIGTPSQSVAVAGLDPLRWQADVAVDAALLRPVGDAAASARAVDVFRVALAVEAIGVARWCLEATVEHLKTRVQFGKPLGSFQALQHRAADLAVLLESAAATASYAVWAVADAPDELSAMAPLALAVCGDAAYRIAAETIQLHGGIGFTWEHDAHLYFKRAATTKLLLGDTHVQRHLAAQRAGLLRPGRQHGRR
jgi:alkylation response protein AidB-like acyl-CoA dehydrogenase